MFLAILDLIAHVVFIALYAVAAMMLGWLFVDAARDLRDLRGLRGVQS